jgi:hypothetical protein
MATDSSCAVAAAVQRWRRSVVRGWVITMAAALLLWLAASALALPAAVEAAAGTILLGLGGYACWNMRRGRCPNCGVHIRFEPRIELPQACRACGVDFGEPAEARE